MKPRHFALGTGLAFVVALPYLGILPGWTPALATLTALTAISLIGINLIFGVCGMLTLGQAAFVALPGYIGGILHNLGAPIPIAITIGIVAAVAIARLVAEIFIRLPGIYFAIGTLGFASVVEGLARAFPSITGGASGLVLEPPVALGRNGWYGLAVAALAAGLGSYAWLARGRFLRSLKLMRHDELAAETMGIDRTRLKARIFTIGSAYSAVGGALLAYYVQVLTPESAGVNASLEALVMTIVGGAGSLFGPLLGAAVLQWLFKITSGAGRYELLLYGISFFVVVLFAPTSIAGALRSITAAFIAKLKRGATTEARPAVKSMSDAFTGSHPAAASERRLPGDLCLRVENVSVHFGGVCAVDHVSFDVLAAEIVAIIGPNGAGKSTLFNVISGIEPPSEGRLWLKGEDLTGTPIYRRAAVLGRSFQVPRLVPGMTALENVMSRLDHLPVSKTPASRTEEACRHAAAARLAAFGLEELSGRPVGEIGIGHHKLIELARASAGQPPLLLLDEPAVGLTAEEIGRLGRTLKWLKDHGTAILVIEHNVDFVADIADRVVVMESGRVIACGTPTAVIADPAVQAAYLGVLA